MTTPFSYMNAVPPSWKTVLQKYAALPESDDQAFVTYVWVDGTGETMRCKTKTLNKVPNSVKDIPNWGFCGYGTYMSDHLKDSNRILVPKAMYANPFHYEQGQKKQRHKLVLCETFMYDSAHKLIPALSNKRHACQKVCDKAKDDEPWFGYEQEYVLKDMDGHPMGWPKCGYPAPMGPYYCSVGADRSIGRDIVHAHYKAAIYAGVNICGINSEAMPSQWEFQTGPTEGIAAADELWMSRFILSRVAEDFCVAISFDPKPVALGNWSGSGAHCNFSTKAMREDGGLKEIETAIKRLQVNHDLHIKAYDPNGGEDNKRRLTGKNETADIKDCSTGVEDRGVALRIPIDVYLQNKVILMDEAPKTLSSSIKYSGIS